MSGNKRILDLINSPYDLKVLSDEELCILANEIREEIISTTSKVGGHVSSSLGAVEIILAVHSLLNCPTDKFIFDVGHQSYTHKLITGRKESFKTIRSFDGLSGFPRPQESEYDVNYAGHAADSLSIAMGLAKAKKIKGSNEKIVALIGDASISGGMAFEAINHIGQENLPMVIVLNDNRMSISEPVGALGNHFRSLRLNHQYKDAADAIKYALMRLGSLGDFAIKCAHNSKESLKKFILPDSLIFEELGITCVSSINGHDIAGLKSVLKDALKYKGPVIVHVVTQKGHGYKPACDNPELYHGIGPYNISTGKPLKEKPYTFTNAFSDEIVEMASTDNRICALTAAMSYGTGLKKFEEMFPDRFIDVGIAEEHLVGCASGLAKSGLKPYVAIYSSFLQRAIDQMSTNVAIDNLDVTFCIDRAGIVGADGVTHHGMMDIVYTKMIPNFTVIAPSCSYELKCALKTSQLSNGPFAIRYPKGEASDINDKGQILKNIIKSPSIPFNIGESRTLKSGNDVAILAFGSCVKDALLAHEKLKENNISATVIDMRFIKPIDESAIIKVAKKCKRIICVEDGFCEGGVSATVLACLNKNKLSKNIDFIALGVEDNFIHQGEINELKKAAKIDSDSIVKAAL